MKGLILVFTGEGKGKTTAALGLALRAAGHGLRVLMVQFIKRGEGYGELKALESFPLIDIVAMGHGFIPGERGGPAAVDIKRAKEAWRYCQEQSQSGRYDLLILDEISHAVRQGLLPLKEVLDLMTSKPASLHLVLTGRYMPEEILDRADMVTEMRQLKHHYQRGILAQPGIEY